MLTKHKICGQNRKVLIKSNWAGQQHIIKKREHLPKMAPEMSSLAWLQSHKRSFMTFHIRDLLTVSDYLRKALVTGRED